MFYLFGICYKYTTAYFEIIKFENSIDIIYRFYKKKKKCEHTKMS